MFSETLIHKMKQNNVSADSEKTKEYVSRAWKSASKSMQNDILGMAGVARSTVHRSYRTGRISAKLAMAMAQVLDMDPFYFVGSSDVPGAFDEDRVEQFLQAHRYGEIIYEWNQSGLRRKSPGDVAEPGRNGSLADSKSRLDMPTEEELVVLLQALIIKARSDVHSAQTLIRLKQLLLG